jgi:hypothetical protein
MVWCLYQLTAAASPARERRCCGLFLILIERTTEAEFSIHFWLINSIPLRYPDLAGNRKLKESRGFVLPIVLLCSTYFKGWQVSVDSRTVAPNIPLKLQASIS